MYVIDRVCADPGRLRYHAKKNHHSHNDSAKLLLIFCLAPHRLARTILQSGAEVNQTAQPRKQRSVRQPGIRPSYTCVDRLKSYD